MIWIGKAKKDYVCFRCNGVIKEGEKMVIESPQRDDYTTINKTSHTHCELIILQQRMQESGQILISQVASDTVIERNIFDEIRGYLKLEERKAHALNSLKKLLPFPKSPDKQGGNKKK